MSDDWLELPPEPSYFEKRMAELGAPIHTSESRTRELKRQIQRDSRDAQLVRYKRRLTLRQRRFLEVAGQYYFNKAKAIRAMAVSENFSRGTVNTWLRNDKVFRAAWDLSIALLRDTLVRPDNLVLRAHEIGEEAMTEQPIVGRDGAVLGYDMKLDTALRANEQQMKVLKMIGGDVQSTRVTVKFVNLAGMDGLEADSVVAEQTDGE